MKIIEITDNSMAPTLRKNEKVLIKEVQKKDWKYCTGAVFIHLEGMSIVARIIENNLGTITLGFDNSPGSVFDVTPNYIHGIEKIECTVFKPIC